MPVSLRTSGGARTVLLRMAADQERAERIRALKQDRPDLTWRRIADYVGVTERSAADWQRKGGIEYDNAKRLAELFEVDVDYIWRGTDNGTPSPFAGQDQFADRLDRIEQALAEARQEREAMRALIDKQNGLLQRQSAILDKIEAAVQAEEDAAKTLADANEDFADRVARRFAEAVHSGPQSPGPAPRRRAKRKTPQG